jgi:hypothetical protein
MNIWMRRSFIHPAACLPLCDVCLQVSGVSPLWVAVQGDFQHIYSFLLNRGARVDSLLQTHSELSSIRTAQRDIRQQLARLDGRQAGFPVKSAVVSFVKLITAQMSIHSSAGGAGAAAAMSDGGVFVTEDDLLAAVDGALTLQQVQAINATPYRFRREVLSWAQPLHWKLFPPSRSPLLRHSAPHKATIRRYIEFMSLLLNVNMVTNIINLRKSSRLCLKFRQFPVPHAANKIIELQLIESYLGFGVAEHVSTGVLCAAVLKITALLAA